MTSTAARASRGENILYVAGVMLSVPTLISLIHRHLGLPVAPQIHEFITGYRALADGVASVIHAPLRNLGMAPPPSLIDLHILSFAGMGMMTRALETPGQSRDIWHGLVWGVMSFVFGYLLVGILVIAAIFASLLANPIKPFHSDNWIETTPILEGPQGRLRRERAYKLERDLARIMAITLGLVGAYFLLNAAMLQNSHGVTG